VEIVQDVLTRVLIFTAFDFLQILTVDPFLGITTTAAYIAIDVYARKNSCTCNNIITRAVCAGVTINTDNIIAAALGANPCCFHVEHQSF